MNVLVGPNNVGESAAVDALLILLAGHEEPYPRLDIADSYWPEEGEQEGDISFHFVFKDLSHDDEADFIAALQPGADNAMKAHYSSGTPMPILKLISYSQESGNRVPMPARKK